jgi:hypothetical protein
MFKFLTGKDHPFPGSSRMTFFICQDGCYRLPHLEPLPDHMVPSLMQNDKYQSDNSHTPRDRVQTGSYLSDDG